VIGGGTGVAAVKEHSNRSRRNRVTRLEQVKASAIGQTAATCTQIQQCHQRLGAGQRSRESTAQRIDVGLIGNCGVSDDFGNQQVAGGFTQGLGKVDRVAGIHNGLEHVEEALEVATALIDPGI